MMIAIVKVEAEGNLVGGKGKERMKTIATPDIIPGSGEEEVQSNPGIGGLLTALLITISIEVPRTFITSP